MAALTSAVTTSGLVNTYTYTLTDQSGNIASIVAVGQIVTISMTTGAGLLKDGQAMLATLLELLASGRKPRVLATGSSSFYDLS